MLGRQLICREHLLYEEVLGRNRVTAPAAPAALLVIMYLAKPCYETVGDYVELTTVCFGFCGDEGGELGSEWC